MTLPTRRSFLRAGLGAGVVTLAGCTSIAGSSGRSEGSATLRTYDVAGSPGGQVPVLPDGRVALLDWWATWCAPCKPQMGVLREIHERFPDIHMLSITNEGEDAPIEEFWREHRGTWPVASDTELRTNERFGVDRIPTLLVFDTEGTDLWRHVGLAAADSVAEQLREAGAEEAET
ncbi:TlpA family protein disulfide reductase [Salinirubellus sp. GCM10025818]|uniref:TlpA family protein disulfide reductase n=1 Tax=Salinirubellus TaxID=2162630 RepID=UPI0030CE95F6